jgi:hypothetical protein
MAQTNFNLFKELLEKSNQKTAKTGPYWFKPVAGSTHTLRFLPLKSRNFELPLEIYNHHAINFPDGRFESFACPQKAGEGDCPFCQLASASYKKYTATATDDQSYKDAFKQLVVKQNYLLVGYEADKIDTANITEESVKIVRASSKASMETIVSIMSKEKDFVDFDSGRNVELLKPAGKGAIVATTWAFQDPEPAFTGKKGKETWDKLIEVSPDLTNLITPPTKEKMAELMARFTSQPKIDEPVVSPTMAAKPKASTKAPVVADDMGDDEMAELRKSLED